MNWTYEQATGQLLDPNGDCVATGYAGGDCGEHPEGKNNPDAQNLHSIGPLPIGTYEFCTPIQMSHLGPYAIPLKPSPENEMFERGSFYMHGDSVMKPGCASEGCIIMPRDVRESCWDSACHTLVVVRGN